MRKPQNLAAGDTICVVAPSFGCTMEPYISLLHDALLTLRQKGFHVEVKSNVYKNDGLGISTHPQDCAQELMEAYCDPSNQAIISAGGGELMCEILPYLDFDKLKKAPPKWFSGFSDNTNFTFTLNTICDVESLYGPNICEFASPWSKREKETLGMMMGTNHLSTDYSYYALEGIPLPKEKYARDFKKVIHAYHLGKEVSSLNMEGMMLGGCLDVLANLVGTRFDRVNECIKEKKIIWFLEACDLSPMGIRRAIWSLKEAGWFKNCAGILFGRPLAAMASTQLGVDEYNAALDLLDEEIPILFDCDFGHINPTMPIVSGAYAKVSFDGHLTIEFQ